ncbi:glycosyl transferase [Nocardiopsis terrae]|uniref:4,4'-diaponeurosporenoate glycosyltransferase n=1 Tax=Nocardiopsis terrae TaxID=372655 RepID=A0ABR9HF33_9ACTN|nr:glycosyltransferase [Nocardiopsis terrae]MBE1457641.1 glycosyltransferase involved in cell wall biosynthesis [Nocardiopsis terrae]GHC85024.1 glycosyl transferase [Nocardiopsis terrae]
MTGAVVVVVPAHEEAASIVPCLRAVHASLRLCGVAPERRHSVVVADDCTDATAALARREGARVVEVAHRNVGAARRAGAARALELVRPRAMEDVWLATTDADTLVPVHWLPAQLALARTADAVVGTVEVRDWSERPSWLAEHFARTYPLARADGHPHVHGANLGVRASAYLACGGFPELARAEDHALVTALAAGGYRVSRPRDLRVVTSARRASRAAGGFGDCLSRISAPDPLRSGAVAETGDPGPG